MASSNLKLAVWTEGLNEDWIAFPSLDGHVERDPMTPGEVVEILERINEENGGAATCLFILQANNRRLHLTLARGSYSVSDPGNANYQNVKLDVREVPTFLEGYFDKTSSGIPEHAEIRSSHLRLLEGTIAMAAVLVLAVTVYFVSRYMNTQSSFMPEPTVNELTKPEALDYITRYAGIYATQIGDGEMVIELDKNGHWSYYDVWKQSGGSFTLTEVEAGSYRPVLDRGRLAALTDTNFLFYLSEENRLEFLQRHFSRVARNREDLPYVKFPASSEVESYDAVAAL